jgi:hypothetical protein
LRSERRKLANKKKFYEFCFEFFLPFFFPVAAHTTTKTLSFQKFGFSSPIHFPIVGKKSFFLFADNLLLYLGRWDVDRNEGGKINRKPKKRKS